MSTPPIQYSGPVVSPEVPFETRRHLQLLYQKLANHTQAFTIQQQQIAALKTATSTSTTVEEVSGGGGSTPGTVSGISVNDQTGQTSYATTQGDNNALIVFSDASAIAVSLTSQTPPWSAYIANVGALGHGTVTLTPATGTINGASTLAVLPTYSAIVAFDGTDWWAATLPIAPVAIGAVAHEWLNSYNAATGQFTASQPAYSDISGTPQLPNTAAPVAHEFVTGYDATTGNFSQAQPAYADLTGTPIIPATIAPVAGEYLTGYDATTGNFSQSPSAGISATITTAALTPTGTQGSMTFQNGLLVSQVQAT